MWIEISRENRAKQKWQATKSDIRRRFALILWLHSFGSSAVGNVFYIQNVETCKWVSARWGLCIKVHWPVRDFVCIFRCIAPFRVIVWNAADRLVLKVRNGIGSRLPSSTDSSFSLFRLTLFILYTLSSCFYDLTHQHTIMIIVWRSVCVHLLITVFLFFLHTPASRAGTSDHRRRCWRWRNRSSSPWKYDNEIASLFSFNINSFGFICCMHEAFMQMRHWIFHV